MNKTAAWPLAFAYCVLVAYASLFPFDNWRNQGLPLMQFVSAPMPRYWTGFDVVVNVVGYLPLGTLVALALLQNRNILFAGLWAVGLAAVLSLGMETAQTFLPSRIASNLDWMLNMLGAATGVGLAWLFKRFGVLQRWQDWKSTWLIGESRGALVLLALWPLALLYPMPHPFGLGQVAYLFESILRRWMLQWGLDDYWAEATQAGQVLAPTSEFFCMVIGLLVPTLLVYSVMRDKLRRWLAFWGVLGVGLVVLGVSSALSFGPVHAWVWLTPLAQVAIAATLLVSTSMLWVPRKTCLVIALIALVFQLSLLNSVPTNTYVDQTLMSWEQGRFARFNGLSQWLGGIWPYLLLGYVGLRLSKKDTVV